MGPRPAFLAGELCLEWDIVTKAHHNLLLVGLSAATEAMLVALKSTFVIRSQLLRWLRFNEQVQVVSTTSETLFSLVENGAFRAGLYYRLNIVRMELTSAGESRSVR